MQIDQDQRTIPDSLEDPTPEGRPATVRPKASGLSNVVLALLMAGTSWAVAACVSIWLVPPYLILMAWLLFPSAGRPPGDRDDAEQEDSDALRPIPNGEEFDDSGAPRTDSASAGSLGDGSESGTSTSPAKARRGKGRAKKVKPVIEPTEATWVQVAPGKFVRVEAAEASNPAGPHSSLGVPVEVGATPQPPDRDEPEALESEPSSSSAPEATEETGSPGNFEGTSAVDGIAPQAEGSFEETDAGRLEARPEALDDPAEAGPSAELSEDEGEQSSLSEAFEPIGSPPPADVPPEEVDEWGESLAEADPTETPVDETDFDDAGPLVDHPHDVDSSVADADGPETAAFPGPSTGSPCWPWRLAPRAGTRVGHPPRTTGRPSTPRRPVRSSGPPRRPSDPRRFDRQGSGRPRRIIRAFPPRSPPGLIVASRLAGG